MLTVISPDAALRCLESAFPPCPAAEDVPLEAACGRVLFQTVLSGAYIPDFDRSTVDGFALRAADTFGCSDALPALLTLQGAVEMGKGPGAPLAPGCCAAIPTGGALPPGADAAVMQEYCELYGDGTLGVLKPVAPGENLIFRGDDAAPGRAVLPAFRRLRPPDIGVLAALGHSHVQVCKKPRVGILSTGDELVPISSRPGPGQVRDVNGPLLRALAEKAGAQVQDYGILPDRAEALGNALDRALGACDIVVLSGGSSVGEKDAARQAVEARGALLFHGVAMKPGKPTLAANCGGKPVLGLPGHPAAAFFTAHIFLRPLIAHLCGRRLEPICVPARLTEAVSANHGRAQYTSVCLTRQAGMLYAQPIRSKSGLVSALAAADGYICIPQGREGAHAGETLPVTLYSLD